MSGALSTVPTFLDGVTLAVNAVPGTALAVDNANCGQGLPAKIGVGHDLFSDLTPPGRVGRVQFTTINFKDMTLGTQSKLMQVARRLHQEIAPDALLVTAGAAVQLTGEYLDLTVRALSRELGIPVIGVRSDALSGDFLDGFGETLASMAAALPLEAPRREADTVGVVGFPFERHEADTLSNVAELRRILTALGVRSTVVAPCGQRYVQWSELARSEILLGLPHGEKAAVTVGERLGIPVLQLPLPVGLEGTSAWIRAVGKALGRELLADSLVDAELARVVPMLRSVVRGTFAGTRVLLGADPYVAATLAPALAELGFSLDSVAVQTRSAQRAAAARDALEKVGVAAEVHWDPHKDALRQEWERRVSQGAGLAIATSNQRDAVRGLTIPFLELGFPSYVRHALFDAPWMGFRGLLWLADRLHTLLSEHRYAFGRPH